VQILKEMSEEENILYRGIKDRWKSKDKGEISKRYIFSNSF
jgi:hypothetical protein